MFSASIWSINNLYFLAEEFLKRGFSSHVYNSHMFEMPIQWMLSINYTPEGPGS